MTEYIELISNKIVTILYLSIAILLIKIVEPIFLENILITLAKFFKWIPFPTLATSEIINLFFFYSIVSGILIFHGKFIAKLVDYFQKISTDSHYVIEKISNKLVVIYTVSIIWVLILIPQNNYVLLTKTFLRLSYFSQFFILIALGSAIILAVILILTFVLIVEEKPKNK